jgi:hypothetical protein
MNRVDAFLFLARCLEPEDHPGPHGEKLAEEIAAGRVCWERVIEIASEYWMTLALYRELGEKRLLDLLPGDLLEYFNCIHEWNSARNRGILEHASELASLLNRIGVEPLLLKGVSHLASGLYPDAAVRFMSDIDILVPSDRALECWRFLISSGYRTSAAPAGARVDCMPHEHWPGLVRKGRTGDLEMHRLPEWNHMLSSPSLYLDAEPVALGGGKARILTATSHMIFTIAHSYVHHQFRLEAAPLRDLYDATLLLRQHDKEIAWRQVIDAFERGGQTGALRTACMMWRRLFSQSPPCAIDRPPWAWIYWQRCLLKIMKPRWGLVCDALALYARRLRIAFSGTTEAKRIRKEFTPSVFVRKLRMAAPLWAAANRRRDGGKSASR